jgi:hypothetical protein
MTEARRLGLLLVIAHWIVAVWHLFLAAKILPAPNNHVSWLAIILISFGHLGVSIALWKLSDRLSGLVLLIFFLAAGGADLYEHFLHASPNNVFMVAAGTWTARFDVSVFVLLVLEILGFSLGILSFGGWLHPAKHPDDAQNPPARRTNSARLRERLVTSVKQTRFDKGQGKKDACRSEEHPAPGVHSSSRIESIIFGLDLLNLTGEVDPRPGNLLLFGQVAVDLADLSLSQMGGNRAASSA